MLDGELNFAQASDPAFLDELRLLEPFGPGNEEPLFVSPPLKTLGKSRLGNSGNHARLELQDTSTGVTLYAKVWGAADQFGPDLINRHIRVAYTPRKDFYRGIPSIDVAIRDWKITDPPVK